jgi:hypothetical protein
MSDHLHGRNDGTAKKLGVALFIGALVDYVPFDSSLMAKGLGENKPKKTRKTLQRSSSFSSEKKFNHSGFLVMHVCTQCRQHIACTP